MPWLCSVSSLFSRNKSGCSRDETAFFSPLFSSLPPFPLVEGGTPVFFLVGGESKVVGAGFFSFFSPKGLFSRTIGEALFTFPPRLSPFFPDEDPLSPPSKLSILFLLRSGFRVLVGSAFPFSFHTSPVFLLFCVARTAR